jgi:hypothetical protein
VQCSTESNRVIVTSATLLLLPAAQ